MRRFKVLIATMLTLFMLIPVNAQGDVLNSSKIEDKQEKYIKSLEAIQNDSGMGDQDKITQILQNLFTSKAEDYVNNENFNFSIFMDNSKSISKSQKFFTDNIIYMKNLKKRTNYIIDSYTINTKINNISINIDEAVVKLQEVFDFHIKGFEEPSGTGVIYTIKLKNNGNKWLITDICSDNTFEESVIYGNVDMNEYIKSSEQPLSTTSIVPESEIIPQKKVMTATSLIDHYYDRNAAAYYAKYYSTSTHPYNPNFDVASADCANFGSQCVWAGFGGVDDLTYINNKKFPMIDQGYNGARSWYNTQSGSTPGNWSWTSTNQFAKYIDNGGYDVVGPYGFIYPGLAWAQLGDILQVDWHMKNAPTYDFDSGYFDHTFVVTGVTGSTGSRTINDIIVSAHNSLVNHVPLSLCGVDLEKNTLRTVSIGGNMNTVY